MSLTTKTKTETTANGNVEYETTECCGCGYDTPLDAVRVVYIPSGSYKKNRLHKNAELRVKYSADGGQRAYCKDCAERIFGPDLPESNYQRELNKFTRDRDVKFAAVAAIHLVLLVLACVGFVAIVTGPPS